MHIEIIYIYIYIYTYLYLYLSISDICLHAHTYTYIYIHMYYTSTSTSMSTFVCVYFYVYLCIYLRIRNNKKFVRSKYVWCYVIHTCMHAYIRRACILTTVYMSVYGVRIHIQMQMQMHKHIHVQMHIHTHVHTHIHYTTIIHIHIDKVICWYHETFYVWCFDGLPKQFFSTSAQVCWAASRLQAASGPLSAARQQHYLEISRWLCDIAPMALFLKNDNQQTPLELLMANTTSSRGARGKLLAQGSRTSRGTLPYMASSGVVSNREQDP